MATADFAMRVALGALCVFVALLALGAMRAPAATRSMAALSGLATGAYAACSSPDVHWDGIPGLAPGLLFLCAALPAVYWAFARAWFDDETAPGVHAYVAIGTLGSLGLASAMVATDAPAASASLSMLRYALAIALLLHLLWRLRRGASIDLIEERRQARRVLVWAGALYMLGVIAVELWLAGDAPPPAAQVLNLGAIWIVTALTGIALVRWDLRAPARPGASSRSSSDVLHADPAVESAEATLTPPQPASVDGGLLDALTRAMDIDHAYREEGLSIAGLAARLRVPEHRLRRTIRDGFGARNFNEFLHGYRLDEVARRLRDPRDTATPILTLALDAGYASLGPFNRAFKSRHGMTPSQFRAQSTQVPTV